MTTPANRQAALILHDAAHAALQQGTALNAATVETVYSDWFVSLGPIEGTPTDKHAGDVARALRALGFSF